MFKNIVDENYLIHGDKFNSEYIHLEWTNKMNECELKKIKGGPFVENMFEETLFGWKKCFVHHKGIKKKVNQRSPKKSSPKKSSQKNKTNLNDKESELSNLRDIEAMLLLCVEKGKSWSTVLHSLQKFQHRFVHIKGFN